MSARRRRRGRGRESSRGNFLAVGLLLFAFAGLAGLGALAFLNKRIELDQFGCPKDGVKGITVLVVDKSEKWDPTHIDRLRRALDTIKNEMSRGELLAMYVFRDVVPYRFGHQFWQCDPGKSRDAHFFSENPRYLQEQYDATFGAEVIKLEELLLSSKDSGNNSPILEVLSDIADREELRIAGINKRIILISDMLQNTRDANIIGRRECREVKNEIGQPVRQCSTKPPLASLSKDDVPGLLFGYDGLKRLNEFSVGIYQIKGHYSESDYIRAKRIWGDFFRDHGVRNDWRAF